MQVEEVGAFLRALGLADGEDAKQGEDVPFITIRSAHASISFLVVRPCVVLTICVCFEHANTPSSCPERLCPEGQL